MAKKPLGINWESWIDRQIREAEGRGEFNNVPKGKIKGLDRPYDTNWWLRDWVKREKISIAPQTVQMRKHVENELMRFMNFTTEDAIRRNVTRLNEEIRAANTSDLGPMQPQQLLDVDEVLKKWKSSELR